MGTRNLFTIIHDGKVKLAKYNQWDGYLEGQGKGLSDFIVNDLDFTKLIEGLKNIVMLDQNKNEAEIDAQYTKLNSLDLARRPIVFPLLTRDTTIAEQLTAIQNSVGGLVTVDASEFKNDGTFCEYAYELNLDANTVTVWESNVISDANCDRLVLKCDVLQYPDVLDAIIEQRKAADETTI